MVTVRYHRPGKEPREWEQELLADNEDMIVSSFTFRLSKPFTPFGDIPLIKDGYFGVLFDLLNRWFNVVKVFDEDKEFIGYYSDIRTPPERIEGGYKAEDLFIDFWIESDGEFYILDEEEFEEADLNEDIRIKVRDTIEELKRLIKNDNYPPKGVINYELSADEIGF